MMLNLPLGSPQVNRYVNLRLLCPVVFYGLWLIGLFWGISVLAQEPTVPAHPRATLEVEESSGESTSAFVFIVAPVDRIRRDVVSEGMVRGTGFANSRTYEMPEDLDRIEVMDWFRNQLQVRDTDLVFECEGRECGRATIWASEIFDQRLLATANQRQSYLAGSLEQDGQTTLVSVYVIERGTGTIYAHVTEIQPDKPVNLTTGQDIEEILLRDGVTVLEDVEFNQTGTLTASAVESLTQMAKSDLQTFIDETIYVVCHIYGDLTADDLLEESTQRAQTVADVLTEAGLTLVAFGVGPLSPDDENTSRIELVIPSLLPRE